MQVITNEKTQQMLEQALAAQKNAYAPYSNFQVGACVLTKDGDLFSGCNVENASYRLTQCAEGIAIGKMVAAGKKCITAVLVVSPNETLNTPCGACRQTIREFAADLKIPIFLCDNKQIKKTITLEELLPLSFGPENLK